MRGAVTVAAAILLAGCASSGVSTSGLVSPATTTAPALEPEIKPGVLPDAGSISDESSESAARGRPNEPEGLSVVEKRHLYARRVMATCVEKAPNFLAGLRSSALQKAAPPSGGVHFFADRTFRVAASTNGGYCDVRALGGSLDRFAAGMRVAFATRGELTAWERVGDEYRGALVIDGRTYRLRAHVATVDSGRAVVATMRR